MKIDFISDINKDNYYVLGYDMVDKLMVKFAWWSAALFALYSLAVYALAPAKLYPSPFSWRIVTVTEMLWVIVLGFLAAVLMHVMRGKFKNHYLWRFIATNLLFMYPYLVVYISGGSIEWHFHFFVTFAVITLWADWRLGWWAILAVALHHGILNYVSPYWVYFYGRNDIAFLSHAVIVLFMAIVTTIICERMKAIADTNRILAAKLESK